MRKRIYTYADGVKHDPAKQPCCSQCGEKLKPRYWSRTIGTTLKDGKYYPVKKWGEWPKPYCYPHNDIVNYHVERYEFRGYGYNPHIDYDLFCSLRCGYAYGVNIDSMHGSKPNWRHENCYK